MADAEECMQAKDATNSKNSTNDNRARKSRVILTYKRKSRTFMSESQRQRKLCNNQSEPEHEPEPEDKHELELEDEHEPEPEPTRKRQRKQHPSDSLQPTLKRAPKRIPRKKVQFRHVNVEEPISESMDRVQFRGRKVERSFPVAINWDTEKVRNRDKDEQLSGEYGKGKIIERIDYQTITRLAKVDLDINMQDLARGQPHQGGTSEMSRARPSKEQRCPFYLHCNGQCEGLIYVNDDPVQYVFPYDAYYCSPEFFEQLHKLESIAREEIQHGKRVACSPPSFSLGISLEQEATPTSSAPPTPGTVQMTIENETLDLSNIFKAVMDLERRRCFSPYFTIAWQERMPHPDISIVQWPW
ncbi:hypothetical protein Cgig2_028616 [Carnegiea gigantea]|uniref:Uncharacterized protein n=1 Tax=Carnegiea gigantea TaxID=171969 RepID=A0A9Q1K6I4_9CARY|nr:hypothetical protein Cgig2_028616 [Carnegiea gigantea]